MSHNGALEGLLLQLLLLKLLINFFHYL